MCCLESEFYKYFHFRHPAACLKHWNSIWLLWRERKQKKCLLPAGEHSMNYSCANFFILRICQDSIILVVFLNFVNFQIYLPRSKWMKHVVSNSQVWNLDMSAWVSDRLLLCCNKPLAETLSITSTYLKSFALRLLGYLGFEVFFN